MSSENTNEHTEQIIGLTDLMVKTLQATIEADRNTAEEYYRILEETSFKPSKEEGAPEELEMVNVRIQNQNGQTQIISVPKMILMPVPMLHISEATFEIGGTMCLNTTETTEEVAEESSTGVKPQSLTQRARTTSGGRVSMPVGKSQYMDSIAVKLPARNSSNSSESTVETGQSTTNLKISVKMTQSDMPSGLVNLLQVMTNNIQVKNE